MGSQTTLVVASGPGREHLLLPALDSVHQAGLCEKAMVLWGADRWPTSFSEFGDWLSFFPCAGGSLRKVLPFVEATAKESGFAFWMRDDEKLVLRGTPPAPITHDLEILARRGVWVPIVYGGKGHPEPRFFSATFKFPEFVRPTLFGVSPHFTDGEATVGSFILQRQRSRAPKARLRVNLGCGSRTFSLWDNVDHDPECTPDHLLDLGNDALPYAGHSVEAIYFSHALDHLTLAEGFHCLRECHRVLRVHGVLRVVVCDLAAFVTAYNEKDLDRFAYFQPPEFAAAKSQGLKLGMLACGSMSDRKKYSGHKLLMDGEALVERLKDAGFRDVRLRGENEFHEAFSDVDDIFPDHSLYGEATR